MSAKRKTAAATGRKKIAQGQERGDDALGQESQKTASPESKTADFADDADKSNRSHCDSSSISAQSAVKTQTHASSVTNRKNRTADFADDADKGNKSHCDSSAISAQSAVKNLSVCVVPQHADRAESSSRWHIEKLQQLATKIGSGSTPRGGEVVYKSKGVPLMRSMNVHSSGFRHDGLVYLDDVVAKKLDQVTVQTGDVLLNITGASIGRVTTAPTSLHGARVNQHVCIIRPNESLHSPFLAHFLASAEEQARIMNVQVGATRQALTKAMVQNWDVPLPPLPEQHRIVAEIEKRFTRLEAGVAALKRVQANLKRYRAAVLKAACEGRLVPTEAELRRTADNADCADKKLLKSASSAKSAVKTPAYETGEALLARILTDRRQNWLGRGQYKEPAEPDITKLSPLPKSWTWATIEQLSEVVRGSSPRPAGDPRYFGGDVPWITVGPLTADNCPYLKAVPASLNQLGREHSRFIEPHTLLFTNSGATLGVPKISLIGGCINDGVAALLNVAYPLKLYLVYFLRTQTERLRGVNQGAAQPNLNTTIIKGINVPLPPLAEQTRIVAEVERRLSVVEELEAVVSANLQRATRLRQSILQKAFTGELVRTT